MKRKQLIAVLLSAVLSMSVCLPSACVSTWAAESTAEGTTEQIQETDMFEGEPPSEGTEERTTAEESASEGTEDLLPAEEPSAEGTEDSSIVEEPTAEEAEDSSIVEEPTAEGAEDSSIVGEPTGEGTEDTSIAEEPLSEGAEDSSSVEEVTENLSATEESVSEDAASDGEGGVSTEDNTQDSATPIAIGSPGIATFTEEARSVSFTFVPETDGDYTFYSISDYDTFAVLMQGDEEITHQFSGGEGENFRFSVFLNAGLEYVLSVGEENDADGNCTVYVEESEDLGGSGEEQENSNLTAWVVGHEEEKGNSSQTLTNWENAGDLEIGSTYTFQVMAETKDNSEPTFQWFQNHKLIEGATSSTFNAVMYQSSINYFICKVSDSQGNQVEISCQISAGGSEEQNYDDNLKAWIVGHDELRDESQQMIYDWGEESLYIGDTVTLQAEVETKDESTPAVWWYKGYFGGNNPIEGANSLTYEALLDHYWTVYTCCIQDDYGNQVTITCCFDVQRMEGNLTAWVDGHESEKGNEVQDICDWETAGKLHVGDTYTIQILTETQDGSEPAFEWYQGSERQLLEEETSSTFEAVMYQEGSNNFTCYITDTRGNQVSISCEFFAYANLRQGAVPITVGTPATATFSDEARWIPFTFTPETDGRYVFYTESDYDTQAYLYDGNDEKLGCYDGGGEGENFRFTKSLNAGEEYLLRVAEWNSEDCSCIVHVEQVLPTIVSGMELHGDASLLEDGSVQLTPADTEKTGAAWLPDPIDTQNGLNTTFSWFAEGKLGEGITIMFSQEKSLGEGSDRLGFVDGATGIEIDSRGDNNYYLEHIAVIQGNTENHISRKCSEKVSDGKWHQASVLYKPGYLVLYVDGEEAVHAVDITLPDQVYIGASAATGNGGNLHKIKNLAVSEGSSDFPDTNGWENEGHASYTITFNATEGYFEEWDEDTENPAHVPIKTETKTEGSYYYPGDYTPIAPEGKLFKGWSLTEGGECLDDFWQSSIVTGNTQYFAVWGRPCTITYNANGGFFGEWDDEIDGYIQKSSITETKVDGFRYCLDDYTPTAPEGKLFGGWSLTEGGEILDKWENRVLDQDITYYAVWDDGCTVTFDAGTDGYFRANEHMDENYNDVYDEVQFETYLVRKNKPFDCGIISPVASTEKKFMGWSLTEGGPRISDEYLVTGDMTVYAVWADPCTVTFNAGQYGYFEEYKWNEETQMNETVRVSACTEIIGEGGLLIRSDCPSPVGKEDGSKLFAGWSFTDDGKMTGEDEYEVTGDITLYAVWGDPCKVTWNANGGHYTEPIIDYDYWHEVDVPSYTEKVGKGAAVHFEYENPYPPDETSELVGWALSPTGDSITSRTYTVTEDITFYAIWSNGSSPAVKEITDENVTVATDALVYDGKEKKPAVTVTLDGNTLAEGTDYSVEYSNNINAGNDIALVKITGMGEYTGEVTKTFSIAKASQTITASNLSLTYPNKGKITASGNKGALSYTSSNTAIAVVDSSGNVTAKGAGKATITIKAAATANYKETPKQITVTIAKANQTITASNLSLTYPNKGKITVSGSKGKLTYTSSSTAIAAVDGSGNVTAKGAGKATITIKAAATANYNAASKQITVTVAKAAQNITTKAKASSVAVGKTVAVTTTGAQGKVTYKTSNTGIATVNATTGVVTAKKVGTVKITAAAAATSNYNAASKTVTIKVVPAATTSLKADNMAKGIKVTWAKVTGANGYDIYRNSKKVKTITSGTTVTWTDTAANTNNTKYVYKVVAKASTGASTLSRSLTTYKVTAPTNRSAVNSASRKAVLTWTRNASATGYQVQYSLTSNFSGAKTVTITKNTTLTTTVSSLTKGKTYYTRIRAYKTVGSSKYYSNWSAARSVKISK